MNSLAMVFAFTLTEVCAAQEPPHEAKQTRATIEKRFRSFEYGDAYLRSSTGAAFVSVDFENLPTGIKSQMYNRLAGVLQRDARPQTGSSWAKPGRMTVRAFAAGQSSSDDLIEYQWLHLGQTLRAVASRNALRLDIDLDEVDRNMELREFGTTRLQHVRGLVESMLRLRGKSFELDPQPFEIQIPWPDTLNDGLRFSTNPDKSIMEMDAARWYERVDFLVHAQTLSIRFYFKPGQLTAPQDGSIWFDNDFRALVQTKAAEQDH